MSLSCYGENRSLPDRSYTSRDPEITDTVSECSLKGEEPTPLPKLQLAITCCVQFAEPVTCTVIYPFVNQLVRESGVTRGDDRKTGYYAGLIESVFFATEAITVLQWGRWSDRVGRKPILLGGLLGLTVSMLAFGLSTQFWGLVISRCAQGAFNGNIGVIKSVMAEITDASNVAQAFASVSFVWSIGATMGPVIGGLLANPADRWPDSIGHIAFFRKFPYFLPCAVAGLVSLACFLFTVVGLKETHPPHEKPPLENLNVERDLPGPATITTTLLSASTSSYGATDEACSSTSTLVESNPGSGASSILSPKPAPGFRELLIPSIINLNINYAILCFNEQYIQVLIPLVYSTSIPLGGLGFSPYVIGLIMSIWGVCNGVIQMLAFASIRKLVGHRNLYRLGLASYLVSVAAFPLMNFLAKREGRVDGWVWAVLVVQLAVSPLSFMSFGCMFIYLTRESPSRDALGSTNGLAQMTASTMRTLAPTVASSLFSLSLEWRLAGGTAVYWILYVVVFVGLYCSRKLPDYSN